MKFIGSLCTGSVKIFFLFKAQLKLLLLTKLNNFVIRVLTALIFKMSSLICIDVENITII